jgi:hypothetical protein
MMMEYLLEAAVRLRLLSTLWLVGVGVVGGQAAAVVLGVFVLAAWRFQSALRTRLRWAAVVLVGFLQLLALMGALPFSAASHPLVVVAAVDSTLTGTA